MARRSRRIVNHLKLDGLIAALQSKRRPEWEAPLDTHVRRSDSHRKAAAAQLHLLDKFNLGRHIARDFEADGLLANLRLVPNLHEGSSVSERQLCAVLFKCGYCRWSLPVTLAYCPLGTNGPWRQTSVKITRSRSEVSDLASATATEMADVARDQYVT